MKNNNSIIYIIVFTLFLIFVGAPFFNWIATNEWRWRFINENNYSAWIGYYGAIIGGALTLGGVWWTIKDNEKRRREDLAIQFKPYLKLYFSSSTNTSISNSHKNDFIENISGIFGITLNYKLPNRCFNVVVSIENVGNGECFLKCIDDCKVITSKSFSLLTENSFEYSPEIKKNSMINSKWSSNIFKHEQIRLLLQILYSDDLCNREQIVMTFPLIYYDQFKENKYNAELRLSFVIFKENNKSIVEIFEFNINNIKISKY